MKTELNEFPTGDKTVLQMIESGTFDAVLAETLLSGVDLNAPICDLSGYSTTYLRKAVDYNDLPAVAFLLAHGADPNLHLPELFDDCALFQLQFLYPEHDPQTRYEISKLFFRYGADPNIKIDGDYLYDDVVFDVYNEPPSDDDAWEYLLRFYKLLVVFGGGSEDGIYGKPRLKNVDPSKVDEYGIRFSRHEDGYHICGFLVDANENVIGEL